VIVIRRLSLSQGWATGPRLGCNLRVGPRGQPFLANGEMAKSNGELVEVRRPRFVTVGRKPRPWIGALDPLAEHVPVPA